MPQRMVVRGFSSAFGIKEEIKDGMEVGESKAGFRLEDS